MILNLCDNKYYIGSAINVDVRWRNHINELNRNSHRNSYLQRAWNKNNESSFKFYVLEYVKDKNELINREQYWIDKLNAYNRNYGYNLRIKAHSNIGIKWSEETKKKMSIAAASIGRHCSKEHKLIISATHKGNKYRLGKMHSEETKIKMRNAIRNISEEGRQRLSTANLGKKQTKEHIEKRMINRKRS